VGARSLSPNPNLSPEGLGFFIFLTTEGTEITAEDGRIKQQNTWEPIEILFLNFDFFLCALCDL